MAFNPRSPTFWLVEILAGLGIRLPTVHLGVEFAEVEWNPSTDTKLLQRQGYREMQVAITRKLNNYRLLERPPCKSAGFGR
jgi:hypothetical protein